MPQYCSAMPFLMMVDSAKLRSFVEPHAVHGIGRQKGAVGGPVEAQQAEAAALRTPIEPLVLEHGAKLVDDRFELGGIEIQRQRAVHPDRGQVGHESDRVEAKPVAIADFVGKIGIGHGAQHRRRRQRGRLK